MPLEAGDHVLVEDQGAIVDRDDRQLSPVDQLVDLRPTDPAVLLPAFDGARDRRSICHSSSISRTKANGLLTISRSLACLATSHPRITYAEHFANGLGAPFQSCAHPGCRGRVR